MTAEQEKLLKVMEAAQGIIFGKEKELKLAITAILARGHILLEDIPGVGKTTFVMCLSQLLGLRMTRIQFTNDLLPADVLGTQIYQQNKGDFQFHPGPIFSEIVLGDELNRASPKSQSAFLQAMEEQKVTIDGRSYDLPIPFFIIATQNPLTQIGTNPLPESQLDRFMMKLALGYPDRASEIKILKGGNPRHRLSSLKAELNTEDLLELQLQCSQVHISEPIFEYVQDILTMSRTSGTGLSPRSGLLLLQSAQAWAFINNRKMILPDDIQTVAPAVLQHRLAPLGLNTISLLKSVPIK